MSFVFGEMARKHVKSGIYRRERISGGDIGESCKKKPLFALAACGGFWWLRSPNYNNDNNARNVNNDGNANNNNNVNNTNNGVVPDLFLSLREKSPESGRRRVRCARETKELSPFLYASFVKEKF